MWRSRGRRLLSSSLNNEKVVKFNDLAQFIKTKTAVDDAHVRQLILGQQYKPLRFLGRGRFGKVYLCSRSASEDGELFAIKVLNVERDRKEYNWTWLTKEERDQSKIDASQLDQFIRQLPLGLVKDHMLRAQEMLRDTMAREENPQLRRIRRPVAEREILLRMGPHPMVANLLTSFRDNRFMCLVFDYFSAGSLNRLLAQETKFELPVARFLAAQLLLSLEFLQEKNVSHRDVKPSNILLKEEGWIALADFGLATRLRGGLKNMCGTAEYIAPEVLSEKMWSASGLDLWAFGITLYQLLTGKTPFEAPDATSVFLNTLTMPLRVPDFLPEDAQHLLLWLLTKEQSQRPTISQVKEHAFFQNTINWDSLLQHDASAIPVELTQTVQKLLQRERVKKVDSVMSSSTTMVDHPSSKRQYGKLY